MTSWKLQSHFTNNTIQAKKVPHGTECPRTSQCILMRKMSPFSGIILNVGAVVLDSSVGIFVVGSYVVGAFVGANDLEGGAVGVKVVSAVGDNVGAKPVGAGDGAADAEFVGASEGRLETEGESVAARLGAADGASLGTAVGSEVRDTVGSALGAVLGDPDGDWDGVPIGERVLDGDRVAICRSSTKEEDEEVFLLSFKSKVPHVTATPVRTTAAAPNRRRFLLTIAAAFPTLAWSGCWLV